MRTSIHLPDDLLARAKKKAVSEGRTLTALIEEGLRIVVAGRANRGKVERRSLPRISTAINGLVPGVDPVKFVQEAEEQDDITVLQRLARKK